MHTVLPSALTAVPVLTVVFVYLGASVTGDRFATGAGLGSDADRAVPRGREDEAPPLFVAIGGHAGFAEYVLRTLLPLFSLAAHHADATTLEAAEATLMGARSVQPIGLGRRSPKDFRAGWSILQSPERKGDHDAPQGPARAGGLR